MGSAATQGRWWSSAARDWAELQEPTSQPLWEAMLDAAAVGPGTRVLDAGCGAGGASMLAASRGALVNGIDAASDMLAIAHERVPDAAFQVGDLAALPYPDGTFEAVIAANVVQHVTDPLAVAREWRRVCLPRGRVVVAVCGGPEECAQHTILAAVRNLFPAPLGVIACALAVPGALQGLLTDAGLRVRGDAIVACRCVYPDPETAALAQLAAGPLQVALRVIGEQALRAAARRVLAPYHTSTGDVRLYHRHHYVIATTDADRNPAG